MIEKLTFDDAAIIQRHIRAAMVAKDGLTVSLAFEIARSVAEATANHGRPPGTFVNSKNEVKPIPGLTNDEKPVRPLRLSDIEAIDVEELEGSPDDPQELTADGILKNPLVETEEGIVPELPVEEDVQQVWDGFVAGTGTEEESYDEN